ARGGGEGHQRERHGGQQRPVPPPGRRLARGRGDEPADLRVPPPAAPLPRHRRSGAAVPEGGDHPPGPGAAPRRRAGPRPGSDRRRPRRRSRPGGRLSPGGGARMSSWPAPGGAAGGRGVEPATPGGAGGGRGVEPATPGGPGAAPLSVSPEVRTAVEAGGAVVALESTIIAHGLPYPENLALAHEVERVVR